MKRRRRNSSTETKIVLEGIFGGPPSETCDWYGIHQNRYYICRDKFLSEVHRPFDTKKQRRVKKSLVLTWISGFIITTEAAFIPHMDAIHRFRLGRIMAKKRSCAVQRCLTTGGQYGST